jgi:hypothetical protein
VVVSRGDTVATCPGREGQGRAHTHLTLERSVALVVQVFCGICVKMVHPFVLLKVLPIFSLKYKT